MNKENLANGLISGSVTTGATSFPLKTGYGATMPAVPFKLTLTPFGQLSTKGNSEIILVTARTGDNLDTVVRAQDGTTAKSFSDGDIASNGVYVSDILGVGSFVPKETPTGLVNSSNTAFTTAAPYVGGSLQAWVNGLPQFDYITEVSPGAGTFSFQDAPDTGDQVRVTYQQLITTFGNADTVDGRHANATPTANTLLPLDSSGKYNVKVFPGTILATATRNTTLPYTGGDQQILSIVVTVTQDMIDSGRKLKLTFFAPQLYSNDASSRARVTIYEGSTVLTRTYQPMQGGSVLANTVNIATPGMAMPSLGNHTYTVNFSRDVGSGTSTLCAEAGADMWLEAEIK